MLTPRRLLVALFFISLFVLSARNVTDPDFGWHLRTGEYVVSTLSIPHFDFFSFTASGQTWITHEWLAQVLMYLLYRLGGFGALTLFFALASTLTFGVVYLRCGGLSSPGRQPYVAAFVVLLAAIGAAPFWGARPHTISLLLTSLFLFILDRYRRERGDRRGRILLWLIPLMLIWANSHGSFALGPVLIAVYLGADWVEKAYRQFADRVPLQLAPSLEAEVGGAPLLSGKGAPPSVAMGERSATGSPSLPAATAEYHCEAPRRVWGATKQSPYWWGLLRRAFGAPRNDDAGPDAALQGTSLGSASGPRSLVRLLDKPLAAILVACVAAIALNPNGANIYTYPFQTLGSHAIQTYIQEWQPPDFASRAVQPFLVFLVLTLLALAIARPRASLASLILFAAFTYASLRASRQISIWVLIAAPLLAASVAKILRLPAGREAVSALPPPRGLLALNWVLLLLVVLAGAIRIADVVQTQSQAEREYFPVQAVDTLLEKGWRGPIFNRYDWGGYLIWRLYPRERVFIDGRSDVYSLTDDFVVREYLKAYTASADWREPLDRYGVQLVLVEPDAPLAAQLARAAGWKQLYADSHAVMYERQ